MNLQPISPKHVRLRILGQDICLYITAASSPEAELLLDQYTIGSSELGFIQHELCMNHFCGEFEAVSETLFSIPDREAINYAGTWQVIPDYRQLLRIYNWWYNYVSTEALTRDTFVETYGRFMGEHYFEKWTLYDHSVVKMIGYFGRSITLGQKFIDMIMDAVARYERRTNPDHAEVSPSVSPKTDLGIRHHV